MINVRKLIKYIHICLNVYVENPSFILFFTAKLEDNQIFLKFHTFKAFPLYHGKVAVELFRNQSMIQTTTVWTMNKLDYVWSDSAYKHWPCV